MRVLREQPRSYSFIRYTNSKRRDASLCKQAVKIYEVRQIKTNKIINIETRVTETICTGDQQVAEISDEIYCNY